MANSSAESPNLARLRGVVAPEILVAAAVASQALREAGIPHALAGGLAVGAHGYPRTTENVNFLVGDEAFINHSDGQITLKVPLIAVGKVRVDFVPLDSSKEKVDQLRSALANPPQSEKIPVVPLTTLVYMKLKAGRQKDVADLVELLKRGQIAVHVVDRYLQAHAPEQVEKWEWTKSLAAKEE